jgi:hypothetical protein
MSRVRHAVARQLTAIFLNYFWLCGNVMIQTQTPA